MHLLLASWHRVFVSRQPNQSPCYRASVSVRATEPDPPAEVAGEKLEVVEQPGAFAAAFEPVESWAGYCYSVVRMPFTVVLLHVLGHPEVLAYTSDKATGVVDELLLDSEKTERSYLLPVPLPARAYP